VGAGLGLRQGEAFGLGIDVIDFLRREVEVRRQVKWLSGRGLVFAPPRRGKTRTVPLPEVVAVALAEHIRRFPPIEVTLPWTGKGGGEVTVPLVFSNTAGGPLNRGSWNDRVWKPALRAAGLGAYAGRGLPHAAPRVCLDAAQRGGERRGGGLMARAQRRRSLLLRTDAHVMPSDAERGRAVPTRRSAGAAGTG
jgi:integrase